MAIEFVSPAGVLFGRVGGGTTFTINKPSNVANGHFMVAVVAFWANGSQKAVTPPSGWVVQQNAYRDVGADELQFVVLTRQAGASEPSSWSGSLSGTVYLLAAVAVAYSGVQSLGPSASATAASATSLSTPTVSNSTTGALRVTLGAYFQSSSAYTISSNETTRRVLATTENTSDGGAVQAAIWDLNGALAPGNTTRAVSRSSSWAAAAAAIMLLYPASGTPATGSATVELPKVDVDFVAEPHNDAQIQTTLPKLGADLSGHGPIDVSAAGAVVLPKLGAALEGELPVAGSMDVRLALLADFVGETRAFGERVVTVEYDKSRLVIVPSRGVDG